MGDGVVLIDEVDTFVEVEAVVINTLAFRRVGVSAGRRIGGWQRTGDIGAVMDVVDIFVEV